mgnify:CR=1 FL=1
MSEDGSEKTRREMLKMVVSASALFFPFEVFAARGPGKSEDPPLQKTFEAQLQAFERWFIDSSEYPHFDAAVKSLSDEVRGALRNGFKLYLLEATQDSISPVRAYTDFERMKERIMLTLEGFPETERASVLILLSELANAARKWLREQNQK